MDDKQFLEKAHNHHEYEQLLKYQTAEEVDAALLRLKKGEGVIETYYEYRFTVEKEALSGENPHFSNLLRDIEGVFLKYLSQGIKGGDWDSKGGSYPMGLDIVEDILK